MRTLGAHSPPQMTVPGEKAVPVGDPRPIWRCGVLSASQMILWGGVLGVLENRRAL
jgi:hypothetical protein